MQQHTPLAPADHNMRAQGGGNSGGAPLLCRTTARTHGACATTYRGNTVHTLSWQQDWVRPPGLHRPHQRPMNRPTINPISSVTAAPRLLRPNNTTRVATLNVCKLDGTADAEQLAEELAAAQVSVCGLQETRWRGCVTRDLRAPEHGWKLVLSGSNTSRQAGVGALISPSASKAMVGSEAVTDRILLLHFKGTVDASIVVAYAPTNAAPGEAKDAFYAQLQLALQRIPAHRMTILLGDMNAQVGREVNSWQGIIGGHGVPSTRQPPWAKAMPMVRRLQADMAANTHHGSQWQPPATPSPTSSQSTLSTSSRGNSSVPCSSTSTRASSQRQHDRPPTIPNNNGRRCLQLCANNGLLVANTFFPHPDHHTATFVSNTGNRWAALDLILVSRRFRSSIKDTRVLPRATSHPTDHRLVVCDIALRLKAPPKPPPPGTLPYNTAALGDKKRQEAYQATLAHALQQHVEAHPRPRDSEAEAYALEAALQAAATQHAGHVPRLPRRKPWTSPATASLSAQKRAAYEGLYEKQAALGHLSSTPEADSPLQVVQLASLAQALAAAKLRYKQLCAETRKSARADLTRYICAKARDMDQAMRACNLQRAFALAAELSGKGRPPKVEALRQADGRVATGDKVAHALARHFEATLNVHTRVTEEKLVAIPMSPGGQAGTRDIARAATAEGWQQQQRPQPLQQQPVGRLTRAQVAAAAIIADAAAKAQQEVRAAAETAANDSPPTVAEIEVAIARLRNTAPGHSGITAPLLKHAGPAVVQWLHRCMAAAWESGQAPAAWKRAMLVPIHKKGDRLDPDNYRGVTLLEVMGKAYVTVLHQRIRRHLCNQLLDCQKGFRPSSSTTDALYSMRRLIELARDYNTPLHAAFVDFRKAFDSVNRPTLWRLLRARGVSPKLVSLIEDLYSGCEACTSANGHTSAWFPMSTGVRQGCPMSPTLFNVFMDFMARLVADRCAQRGIQGFRVAFRFGDQLVTAPGRSDECLTMLMLLYADDLVLIADSDEGLAAALAVLEEVATEWGMQMNYSKTKAVRFGGSNGPTAATVDMASPPSTQQQPQQPLPHPQPAAIQLAGGQVQYVDQFCYLGSIQASDCSLEPELDRRLRQAGAVFHQMRRTVLGPGTGVGLKTRMTFYKACVLPVLLYGAPESWAPTAAQQCRLDVFNTTCLRSMVGASRRHSGMISNAELYELTGQPAISTMMQQRRLMWLGHVARKPDSCDTKQLMFATAPAGQAVGGQGRWWGGGRGPVPRRAMGGPKRTWNRLAWGDVVKVYGGSKQDAATRWASDCKDRATWRRLAKSGEEEGD